MENVLEVHNKAQLLAAVSAGPHDSRTVITNRRADGTVTTFKIGPGGIVRHRNMSVEEQFENHLRSIRRKINRVPANVWK